MSLLETTAYMILREALSDPIGIIVSVKATEDVVAPALRAKQVLYRFKQTNRDFDCLQILMGDDPDTEIWIIKKQPENDQIPMPTPEPVDLEI